MTVSDTLRIVEVSPRDGLQNEPTIVPARQKRELVRRAVEAGARRIEAVSFVSPKAVPQMADAEAVLHELDAEIDLKRHGVSLAGLVLNRRGLDRALATRVDEINFVVLASETFNRRNQNAPIAATMEEFAAAAGLARSEGRTVTLTIGAAFGCPFEGEMPPDRVVALAREGAAMGADEIALADTIGVADPLAVETRLRALKRCIPHTPLRCHFHDTRNTAVANAHAAWRTGVRTLDSSVGGIGGCPFAPAATGNVATEDLVYMFGRMGVPTGLDLESLRRTVAWLETTVLGKPAPSALARAGGFPRAPQPAAGCIAAPAPEA